MNLLEQIISGPVAGLRRTMCYGVQGIGKSSFAACAPKPIFIQTEDGLRDIDCAKFPLAKSFGDVMNQIGSLCSEAHDYKTVVIDSLDWLEQLIHDRICADMGFKSIDAPGWDKGQKAATPLWREFLDALDYLRDTRGMHVILIAHCEIKRFDNPETESYDRYIPALHKIAAQLVQEWCDEVLFAGYKVFTKKMDDGKRKQGVGNGERTLRTSERPAHAAKNRLGMPDEIAFDWKVYSSYFPKGGN